MRARVKRLRHIPITGDYIKLDSFMKYVGEAETGGDAKRIISEGSVFVNGEQCILRGKKVYKGSFVRYRGKIWAITGTGTSDGD
jgi:ribosome-associated protein